MKRYFMIGLALVLLLALSTITVAAEDMIYYGSSDGDNTGNISSVNWVLDKDYR